LDRGGRDVYLRFPERGRSQTTEERRRGNAALHSSLNLGRGGKSGAIPENQ